jgi:hypothetical protein
VIWGLTLLEKSLKEAASDEHQRLVKALMDLFEKDGLKIVEAAYEGYSEPIKQGRHEPDILARNSDGLLVVGEAKRCDDLNSARSREQFHDFSNRVMPKGKLEGTTVPFHVITPKKCKAEIWEVLRELGLSDKKNIRVWMN